MLQILIQLSNLFADWLFAGHNTWDNRHFCIFVFVFGLLCMSNLFVFYFWFCCKFLLSFLTGLSVGCCRIQHLKQHKVLYLCFCSFGLLWALVLHDNKCFICQEWVLETQSDQISVTALLWLVVYILKQQFLLKK